MEKILSSKTRIRFQDCDPFNHLNNAKYLDYFINQREDQVEKHYDLNVYEYLKKTGQCWVVGSNQIIYLKPAFLMEEILVETKLIQYDKKSIRVEMQMYDAEKTHLKSLLWIRFMYIDVRTQRSTEHPEDLLKLFETVNVGSEVHTFEERCASLLKS